jgi:MarR family 2-MHQ and catechol resistance regulon transcriptional repressor
MGIDLNLIAGMHRNVNALDRRTAALAKEEGLTLGQFAVLETLHSDGDQTVGTVRDRILSTAGTIPVIVRNLERRGLVRRLPDERDKRVCLLSLTDEGRELIERVIPRNTAMIEEAFSVLSAEEKGELLLLLDKLGGHDGTSDKG